MRGLKALLASSAATLVFVAAGCGGGGDESTLVYGAPADPTALDGALISDGESIRVLYQMTEGLTALRPGTSEVVPALAESWETSADGKAWTFTLREGVTFHDGEPFDVKMKRLTATLREQQAENAKLDAVIAALIYWPFFKRYEKTLIEQEQSGQTA